MATGRTYALTAVASGAASESDSEALTIKLFASPDGVVLPRHMAEEILCGRCARCPCHFWPRAHCFFYIWEVKVEAVGQAWRKVSFKQRREVPMVCGGG